MNPILYHPRVFHIITSFTLFTLAFAVAILLAPILIHYLYKYKAWKKKPKENALGGGGTPIFAKFHAQKETSTPRMGGILIWVTVLIVTLIIWGASYLLPDSILGRMNYVSRAQTWLPLFTLISASLLGLVDDLLLLGNKGKYVGGGMRLKVRLGLIILIALIGGWWFSVKLGWSTIFIPFVGNLEIDGFYLLLFILVVLATFSSGVVDGLDGLSAGVLAPIFAAFGIIAYTEGLFDLVALIIVILGALATYLWFNVHPAKFYMGETGIMGLTVTLAVMAFLTNSVLLLPVIGFVLVLESASVILQLFWKKVFKRKLFLSAPIHHHFQALGWPESQITMRFWIISTVFSMLGLMIFFLSRFF
jgi:phospho-N-acetylmuramoyl-pentapeptide-transferase